MTKFHSLHISLVLNNFIQKRMTAKSLELDCDLFGGSTSKVYVTILACRRYKMKDDFL